MKRLRQTYVVEVFLALLIFVLKPLLPHHHHHGEACFVVEYCESDHVDNDAHTEHHGDLSTCEDSGTGLCSAVKHAPGKQTQSLSDCVLATPTLSTFCLDAPGFRLVCDTSLYINHLFTDLLGRKHGLRAPPLFS